MNVDVKHRRRERHDVRSTSRSSFSDGGAQYCMKHPQKIIIEAMLRIRKNFTLMHRSKQVRDGHSKTLIYRTILEKRKEGYLDGFNYQVLSLGPPRVKRVHRKIYCYLEAQRAKRLEIVGLRGYSPPQIPLGSGLAKILEHIRQSALKVGMRVWEEPWLGRCVSDRIGFCQNGPVTQIRNLLTL